MTVPTITDDLVAELEAEAKAFDNLDYDSNTNPFFNGPSGESLGGDADGTFCVYGEPFEIDGESYDGVTLVERCSRSQAKFIAEAKVRILALLAERAEIKRDAELEASRLDFMLEKHRKVIIEVMPGDFRDVYVEEGFMGDKQYKSFRHKGNLASDPGAARELKRKAIDSAMQEQPS